MVKQKHGMEQPANRTEIVCKFFLEAVEKRLYGWFWQCPNGKECKYRHALPPGYVLKSQMKVPPYKAHRLAPQVIALRAWAFKLEN